MTPIKVDAVDLAFGGKVETLLPKWEDIPEEFQRDWGPWCKAANEWFFRGLDAKKFVAKEGIDAGDAWRHMGAIMRSFAPKHEHKTAGVAWLMSQWFDFAPATETATP